MPKKPKKEQFNRINHVLIEKGYTVKDGTVRLGDDIYKKLGTNKHEFQRWMRNEAQPDARQTLKLCELTNLTLGDFFPSLKKIAA